MYAGALFITMLFKWEVYSSIVLLVGITAVYTIMGKLHNPLVYGFLPSFLSSIFLSFILCFVPLFYSSFVCSFLLPV